MEMTNTVRGEAIMKLRTALKMSQTEFAEKLGVHEDVVNAWESEGLNPGQLKKQQMNELAMKSECPPLDWNALERSHP